MWQRCRDKPSRDQGKPTQLLFRLCRPPFTSGIFRSVYMRRDRIAGIRPGFRFSVMARHLQPSFIMMLFLLLSTAAVVAGVAAALLLFLSVGLSPRALL